MLEYHRSKAQEHNKSAYVKPIPRPFATPLFFPIFSPFSSDLEYLSTALHSPTNEYTVRTCEIICSIKDWTTENQKRKLEKILTLNYLCFWVLDSAM